MFGAGGGAGPGSWRDESEAGGRGFGVGGSRVRRGRGCGTGRTPEEAGLVQGWALCACEKLRAGRGRNIAERRGEEEAVLRQAEGRGEAKIWGRSEL